MGKRTYTYVLYYIIYSLVLHLIRMATHLLEFPFMNIWYEYFDLYEPTYYMYDFEFCNLMAFLWLR
jgi:hypothetical protein